MILIIFITVIPLHFSLLPCLAKFMYFATLPVLSPHVLPKGALIHELFRKIRIKIEEYPPRGGTGVKY
jgi:hypothetical protein